MDNTPPVNKNRSQMQNAVKIINKKKLNDANFGEKGRIQVNAYRAKKKENQSEAEKIIQREKERFRKTDIQIKKEQEQMSHNNNNMEGAAVINIANSCKTPQSLGKAISRVYENLQNLHRQKQAVIKALAKKSGIIHSEKQCSNNVTSNETAVFVKNLCAHPYIVYTMPGMKDEITIREKVLPHRVSGRRLQNFY